MLIGTARQGSLAGRLRTAHRRGTALGEGGRAGEQVVADSNSSEQDSEGAAAIVRCEVRLEKEWRETSDAASYVVSFEGATVCSCSGKIAGRRRRRAISCWLKRQLWLRFPPPISNNRFRAEGRAVLAGADARRAAILEECPPRLRNRPGL